MDDETQKPSRPKLQDVLRETCASTTARRFVLSGGTWIDWDPETRQFKAERLNRLIKDTECADFERFLRIAGLSYGSRQRNTTDVDKKGINSWCSVTWVIAAPRPADPGAPQQGSLFHLSEEA